MASRVLAAVCLLALLGLSFGLGTMWVNHVIGNDDFQKVEIEDVLFDDNSIRLDFSFGLESPGGKTQGVFTEDVNQLEGSLSIPETLLVEEVGTIQGLTNFNGGLRADDGDGGVSFSVSNDEGITYVKGVTNPNGGINVQSGAFHVEDDTGRTTIRDALLRPNGPTIVNNNLFIVSEVDGSYETRSTLTIDKDIILGTSAATDRSIRRENGIPFTPDPPGRTYVKGQSATHQGGNLVLQPGFATGEHEIIGAGRIVLGRGEPDDFTAVRETVTDDAGETTFRGQDSFAGGGSIEFQAGNSVSTLVDDDVDGAHLYLVPGLAPVDDPLASGRIGDIVIGRAAYDVHVRRPTLSSTQKGGSTFIEGQSVSTFSSNPGDLYFRAGAPGGSSAPGNVFLQPGTGSSLGRIVLGKATANSILVSRFVPAGSHIGGGSTVYKGQESNRGSGGDIRFIAGDGATDVASEVGNGGHILLVPGSDTIANETALYWGNAWDELQIKRSVNNVAGSGSGLEIRGQDNSNGAGGSLEFWSGAARGDGDSGSLWIVGADGAGFGTVADIVFQVGQTNDEGGDVLLQGGTQQRNTTTSSGGHVFLEPGSGWNGGDLTLEAGTGDDEDTFGIIEVTGASFELHATDFVHNQQSTQFYLSDIADADAVATNFAISNGTTIARIPVASVANDVGIFRSHANGVQQEILTLGDTSVRTAGQNRFLRSGNELQFNLLEPQLDRFKKHAGNSSTTIESTIPPWSFPQTTVNRAVTVAQLDALHPDSSVCEIFLNYNRLLCALSQASLVEALPDPCTFDLDATCLP